jgi:hypothetical protein
MTVERWLERHYLNYRHLAVALIGLILMWRDRRFDLVGISLLIYAYFLATSAVTLEWGNRTFHPGLIGVLIPAAYAISAMIERFRRWRAIASAS